MSDHQSPCGNLQAAQTEVTNLKEWQRKQNGDLSALREEVSQMRERLDEKISRLTFWAIGTLVSALLAFGVALINLLK